MKTATEILALRSPEGLFTGPNAAKVVDETNLTNPYQGGLRLGRLNAATLQSAIHRDRGFKIRSRLAVTCLDQLTGPGEAVSNYSFGVWSRPPEDFARALSVEAGLGDEPIQSWGPTRATVREK